MRIAMLLLALLAAGCTTKTDTVGSPRPAVVRDVEGYAIASCLVNQFEPYLKDQGDAWASVIVQRMKGDLEVFGDLAGRYCRSRFIVRPLDSPACSSVRIETAAMNAVAYSNTTE
jgi:hypothetical protein